LSSSIYCGHIRWSPHGKLRRPLLLTTSKHHKPLFRSP
jgi:hypothetical protein